MGVIHGNMTTDAQVQEILKVPSPSTAGCTGPYFGFQVKRYENGFIMDPYVLGPNNTVADVDEIRRVIWWRSDGWSQLESDHLLIGRGFLLCPDHSKRSDGRQAVGDSDQSRY